jgi:hypothetical protein
MFANLDHVRLLDHVRRLRPTMIGRAALGIFMIGNVIAGTTAPSVHQLGRSASISTVTQASSASVRADGKAANGAAPSGTDRHDPATSTAAPQASTPAAPEMPAAPPDSELIPKGTQGDQSTVSLSKDQVQNAKKIVDAGRKLKLPPRAEVIAVATSLQETKLNNYGDLGAANDHDSLGLFQQRPSAGWGTPDQLTNPDYATKAFLGGLKNVNGWQSMPLTDAAQAVQVSAFGDRYAQWEQQAADLVQANYDKS